MSPGISASSVLAEFKKVRQQRREGRLRRIVGTLLLASTCGCASGLMSLPSKDFFSLPDLKGKKTASVKSKMDDNEFGSRVETPLLSEYISVQGNNLVVLRSVGLVTGLDGTGDNPPPSSLRTALKDEMSRRGVKNIEEVLASKNTALVIVTAMLPAMVTKGQHFDVRVALPPNSEATSLKGGWLLETRLFEEQVIEGRGTLKGHNYGTASGAILTELGAKRDPTQLAAELRRGSIPGGAVSNTERDLSIVLRADKRGYRNAKRISSAVAARFHDYDRYGRRVPLAVAKTDTMLELKMHKTYRNNFPRYQQVIRSIAFNEGDVARRMRMESLERDIMEPSSASQSAVQLEAIGDAGVPFLKRAMASPEFEVQFHAAQALAYLGDPTGVEVLTAAVREQPALRVYALAALSVIDDADAVVALRSLMSEKELETRYGAFRALQELDPNDPSLRVIEYPHRFKLFLIDSEGEAMVHVNRRRAAEVVLFGADQIVRLPVVLTAGRNIRIIGDGSAHSVTVSKYSLEASEPEKQVVGTRLADIIKVCGDFGATYPDIVQMLIEAQQQHNLTGDFGIDRLPQAGRLLFRDADDLTGDKDSANETDPSDLDESGKRIGTPAMIPNLYDRLDEEEIRRQESEDKLSALKFDKMGEDDEPAEETDTKEPQPDSDESGSDGPDSDQSDRDDVGNLSEKRPVANSEASKKTSEEAEPTELEDLELQQDEPQSDVGTEPDVSAGAEEVDMSKMRFGPGARIINFFKRPFVSEKTTDAE